MIEAANKTLISKTTGISLFLMAVAAGIGYGWAFGGFYVADNPAATAGNLAQAPFALYAAVISFTVVLILGITVSLTLYVLYRHVNQKQALWVSGLRLAYSAVLAVALYRLASTAGVLDVLTEQSVAAMEHLDAFLTIWSFGLIVFGVRLFVPSLLLKKKTESKTVWLLLCAAGCCYTFSHSLNLFFPAYGQYKSSVEAVLGLPMALGELVFAFRLLYPCRKQPTTECGG